MPTNLTGEEIAALRAVAEAATVPVPSNDGLVETARQWRRSIDVNDPASVYFKRPDLAAKATLELEAILLRAGGVTEPVATAQTVAAEQHAARWQMSQLSPAVVEFIAERRAEAAKLDGHGGFASARHHRHRQNLRRPRVRNREGGRAPHLQRFGEPCAAQNRMTHQATTIARAGMSRLPCYMTGIVRRQIERSWRTVPPRRPIPAKGLT
jgi:hypothetical protein